MDKDPIERLCWAVKNGDVETVKEYLTKGMDANQTIHHRKLLHYAADYGHTEIITLLLDKNADIDSKDDYGNTPLMAAVYEGHPSAVEALIKRGASICIQCPSGKEIIEEASDDAVRELIKSAQNK